MFKKGDKVTMSLKGIRWCEIRNGDFYRGGSNPFGVEGTVIQVRGVDSCLPFRVKWVNGEINTYAETDLTYYNVSLENE